MTINNYKANGDDGLSIAYAVAGDHENRITDMTNVIVIGGDEMDIVRRLTPTECARLQGYDDDWVDIPDTVINGKKVSATNTSKYKSYGNSIALPQWWWIVNRMKQYLHSDAKLGSLFDGIGGFPTVWEETYGKKTARWASEIEPFPIAVTMYHFGDEDVEET